MEVKSPQKLPKASLAQQCEGIGWSLIDLPAQKHDKRSWSIDGGAAGLPEEVVGRMYASNGAHVSFCEGGSVLLLMKAAALECSGLMKPDTHLGENARQNEVSDDQTTPYLFP